MRLVVSNTGPLIHLAEAQALDLLPLCGEIHVPQAVVAEAARYDPIWSATPPTWISLHALDLTYANQAQVWEQSGLIQRGEAHALALTLQLRADWFLTDDTAARVLANSLGVEVHGSLGVALWAAATGHLNRVAVDDVLSRLASSSLWISARILSEAQEALKKIFASISP